MKVKKTLRRLAVAFVIVIMLGYVGWLVAHKYAKTKLVELLEEETGGRVEIDDVDLGFQQIAAQGIRVFERDSGDLWLAIDTAAVEMSLWDAIGGDVNPTAATIRGAAVKLRFAADGSLLTYLPESEEEFELPIERIDIHDARLEIDQQQRTLLIANDISAFIRGKQDLQIECSVGDLLGAHWKMDAQIQGATFSTVANVETQLLQLTSEQLNSLPFLPRAIAGNILFDGVTPVKFALNTDDPARLKYRLELSPKSLELIVPDADLHVTETRGRVVVDDNQIVAEEWVGNLADGRFTVDGTLSLQGNSTWRGNVQAKVIEVTAAKLPDGWAWPREIAGVISADAEIDLAIGGSGFEIQGGGQAKIEQAKLLGIRAQPIHVQVTLDKFATDDPQIAGQLLANVELRDVAVIDLVTAADPDSGHLRDTISGKVNCQVELDVPLATATDPQTYQAEATLSSPVFQYDRFPIQAVSGKLKYAGGVLKISELHGAFGEGGKIAATGELQLAPSGSLTAVLDLQDIAASLVAKLLDQPDDSIRANVSGSLTASVPLDDLGDIEAWQGNGKLRSDELVVSDQSWSKATMDVGISKGTLALTNVTGSWSDIAMTGSASMALKQPYAFQVNAAAKDIDVKNVVTIAAAELPVQVTGMASVNAGMTGKLSPLAWQASGKAAFFDLVVEDVKLESTAFDWNVDPNLLRLTNAQTIVFGSDVQLTADIPLDDLARNTISGSFAGLDANVIQELGPEMPVAFSGETAGEFSITGIDDLQNASGHVSIRGLTVTANEMQLAETSATLGLADRKLTLDAGGRLLGGDVTFKGNAPLVESDSEAFALGTIVGDISADHIPLSQLWVRFLPQTTTNPPEGWAHVQLNVEFPEESRQPTGTGRLELRDLRWQGKNLAPLVATNVQLLQNTAVLKDIALDYGGGRIAGMAQLRTDQWGTGTYTVTVNGVDTDKLLIVWPELAGQTKGDISAMMRGQFANRKIEGAGSVQLSRATVADLPINGLHAPVTWSLDTASGRGSANVRLERAEIARGRVSGDVDIDWGRQINVEGKTKLENVDVRDLARKLKFVPDQFNGRFSGNVALQGRNVTSFDDLSGTFQAKLQNSPMLQLPILDALGNSFGIGSPAQMFSETDVKGRLNRGTVHIDRMTMVASTARLFVQGTVTTRGQVDLDVTADTAQTVAAGVALGLLRPVDLLRRRLIFLHVGGSVRSPSVLPKTEKFIQQEIILFFLPFG